MRLASEIFYVQPSLPNRAELERERQARAYVARMQMLLERCPGFVGADPPTSENDQGKVVVEPGLVLEAAAWLRRRFHVREELELSSDIGLVFCIAPRARARSLTSPVKRANLFCKPEQLSFALD